MTKSFKRCSAVLFLLGLFAAVPASRASAQQVSAKAIATEPVVVQDNIAHATFKVELTNKEQSAVTNVWVVFADGSTVAVPDADVDGTAVSEPVSRIIELDLPGSHSIPVEATLKFTVDGTAVEKPCGLVLTRED